MPLGRGAVYSSIPLVLRWHVRSRYKMASLPKQEGCSKKLDAVGLDASNSENNLVDVRKVDHVSTVP